MRERKKVSLRSWCVLYVVALVVVLVVVVG